MMEGGKERRKEPKGRTEEKKRGLEDKRRKNKGKGETIR